MCCDGNCKICKNLIISSAVTFTGGNLVINIPDGNYSRNCKYCIVIAQAIPAETTIGAPVYVTIGTGTTLFPMNKCNCAQATACAISTRRRYPVIVNTTATGGSFKLLKRVCNCQGNDLESLSATTAAPSGDGA